MGNLSRKTYAFVFEVFRRTFKAIWNDGWQEWKALLVLSVGAGFALLAVAAIISIVVHRRILLPQSEPAFLTVWGSIGIGIVIFNYCNLMLDRKASHFEREFESLSKISRVYRCIAVWASLILIVAAGEWTGSIAWKLPPQ
jgi:hypothetical protein